MRNLPLRSQILLAPAATIFLIMALIGFTMAKLLDIKQQNEAVREWVNVCSHAQGAITAGQRMYDIARQMSARGGNVDDDLHFSYLEQSRSLSDNFRYPELAGKLAPAVRAQMDRQIHDVRYRDDLDPVAIRNGMQELLPELEQIYRKFYVQKRTAYTDYYDNVNDITSQLVSVSLYVLAIAVFTGIALSVWTIQRTKGRLGALARDAKKICAGNLVFPPAPEHVRDEVDELAACMSTMTQRLLNVVASEKVLQGAEDERKRIAMDIHDQTLSDITNLSRNLSRLRGEPDPEQRSRHVQALQDELEEIANNMRRIIDDLHPQTLDLLGLEKALRSHLDKRYSGDGMAEYFLHVDPDSDTAMSEFERLSVYRIVLNLVNNVARHAHATRYEIDLRRDAQGVTLIVEDNGTGFDYEKARRNGGHGLTNIEERAKAIGASFRWRASRFTTGTRFELRLETKGGQRD